MTVRVALTDYLFIVEKLVLTKVRNKLKQSKDI